MERQRPSSAMRSETRRFRGPRMRTYVRLNQMTSWWTLHSEGQLKLARFKFVEETLDSHSDDIRFVNLLLFGSRCERVTQAVT